MQNLQFEGDDKLLDDVGWKILAELQDNARVSFAELGRRVGLSAPAVTERVRKLEDAGIITGYHAAINLEKIGLPITAMVRIGNPGKKSPEVSRLAEAMPEVLECHRITGQEGFILRVSVPSVHLLEDLLDRFEPYGATTTSLVLSSPVPRRTIEREP